MRNWLSGRNWTIGAAVMVSLLVSHPANGFAAGAGGTTSDKVYARLSDGAHTIAAVPLDRIDRRLLRQRVVYPSAYAAGTVVVDTTNRYLYLIEANDRAIRYGISVGRVGAAWSGEARIGKKAAWPRWTPPAEMIRRSPDVARYRNGMAGGPSNPLGARALYLHQNGRDTLYRLHGTSEWWTIGRAASSGCIRLMNQDIVDLYARVPMNARVIVRPQPPVGLSVTWR